MPSTPLEREVLKNIADLVSMTRSEPWNQPPALSVRDALVLIAREVDRVTTRPELVMAAAIMVTEAV